MLKARFSTIKTMVSYSLQTQVFILVATVTLNNYIRREAWNDQLFEKYNNDDVIVIDSDDENKKDKAMLTRLIILM